MCTSPIEYWSFATQVAVSILEEVIQRTAYFIPALLGAVHLPLPPTCTQAKTVPHNPDLDQRCDFRWHMACALVGPLTASTDVDNLGGYILEQGTMLGLSTQISWVSDAHSCWFAGPFCAVW
jgi:hypothetical protein